MKKNILRLLCLTLLAGMTFASCEKPTNNDGRYTLTVNSADKTMGKTYGGGTFDGGTTTRIWGTPEVGYQFDHWNDGNTENPRNVTVNGDVTYTAYFSAIGSGNDTTGGGGGGETPGEFVANFVINGIPYQGIALVSINLGGDQNLFNLTIYAGEGTNVLVSFILPRTGTQSLSDGIQSFFYESEDSFIETPSGTMPPYLTVPSAGCTFDVNVTAFDMATQTVSLTASGTMLDIAAAEAGQPSLVPFSVSIDGFFQYPGMPTGK